MCKCIFLEKKRYRLYFKEIEKQIKKDRITAAKDPANNDASGQPPSTSSFSSPGQTSYIWQRSTATAIKKLVLSASQSSNCNWTDFLFFFLISFFLSPFFSSIGSVSRLSDCCKASPVHPRFDETRTGIKSKSSRKVNIDSAIDQSQPLLTVSHRGSTN